MVETKLIALALLFAGLSATAQTVTWEQIPMDGHMTGVTIPRVDNVPEALGTVKGKTYTAPNGRRYRGATAQVASLMIAAQPAMAEVKEYIGYCPQGMSRRGPDSALGEMIVDRMMASAEQCTGLHIDAGLMNYGGIRLDMPKGDVLLDDIVSMLPFRNYLVVVRLKGRDLKALLEHLASHSMQIVGGVTMEVRGHKLAKALVGGKAIEPEKVYNLATIDFLLNKGDGISAARNAVEIVNTDLLARDSFLPFLRQLTAEGKPIEYAADGRVKIFRDDK